VYADIADPVTTRTRNEESSRWSKVEGEEDKLICEEKGLEHNMPGGRPLIDTLVTWPVQKWVYYAGIRPRRTELSRQIVICR
jgi:hypothetical protein